MGQTNGTRRRGWGRAGGQGQLASCSAPCAAAALALICCCWRGARQAVDIKEIFKSQKTTHFKNIHKKTGIAFEDMIFYGVSCPRARAVPLRACALLPLPPA